MDMYKKIKKSKGKDKGKDKVKVNANKRINFNFINIIDSVCLLTDSLHNYNLCLLYDV